MSDQDTNGGNDSIAAKLRNYLGPYEAWNFGIGKAYAFPAYLEDNVRFLTALAEHTEPEKPHSLKNKAEAEGSGMRLPTLWGEKEDVAFRFWPIVVENPSKDEVAPDSLHINMSKLMPQVTISDSRFRMAFPVEENAMNWEAGAGAAAPSWSPDPNVRAGADQDKTINVIGVIDDGIPFAHRNFRTADGTSTRVEFCWLQSAHRKESTQEAVLFGRELTRDVIKQLVEENPDDEDALYVAAGASHEQFGASAAINRLSTHGAHIADIAAGADPEKGIPAREETRLIAVQLPNTYGWDTSSFGKDMYMLSAVHYILERAERIAEGYGVENIRVTINISYGFSAGRHDGAGELEAALDEIVSIRRQLGRPTALVIPTGNTFLDRLHGEIKAEDLKKDRFEFTWRTQPNDRSSNYLEVWFPDQLDPGDFEIGIVSPFGNVEATMVLKADPSFEYGDPRNFETIYLDSAQRRDAIGQISLDNHRKTGRWRVLIALAPSEPQDPSLPAAPAGDWTIWLKRGPAAPTDHEAIYLWVQRDIDLEPFLTGSRQSYLHDEDYRLFDDRGDEEQSDQPTSHAKRFGSLNGMATGKTTLVVAGCRPSAEAEWNIRKPVASTYSSAGKVGEESPVGTVDCAAPADRSNISPGMVAAGTRSGAYALVQGTSVAAPLVARRISEAFAELSDDAVKAAEKDNYLSILKKIELPNQTDEEKARLGAFLVL